MEDVIFRLMNHDSSHTEPDFTKYTLAELNAKYETSYESIEEACESEPEYLFTKEQMEEYLKD